MTKCQKDSTCGIFLDRGLFKDIENYIPMCWTHKYKNTNTKYTNTQIQHMMCQKDRTCGIFLKRGFSELSMYHLCIVSASSVHQHHFCYPWTILFSKIYHLFGLSGTSSYAVFVYFVFVFFVFARLTHGNIIFDMLEQSSFQKYTTCWVFLALRHMLYLCICVFCICIFCICVFDTWEH